MTRSMREYVEMLRKALEASVGAAEHVIALCEGNLRDGDSPNPFVKADWEGTVAYCYAAMSFVANARAALAVPMPVAEEPKREWAVVWDVLRGPDAGVEIRELCGSKVAAEMWLSHWNTVRDQIRIRRCHLESRIPAGPWEPECLEEKS